MSDSTTSAVDRLKALWARLNSDPTAAAQRKTSPDWLVLQWEQHGVTAIEAHVAGQVTLKHVAEIHWGGASNPEDSTASAGSLLKDRLAALKIATKQTAVIVGRDAVIIRRLELPFVPDNELPDMVRFQAATKTATPIDRLALDFVPLDTPPDAPRVAVAATIESTRLRIIQETVLGAGLELTAIGLTATAVAELVAHSSTGSPQAGVSLVVLQKGEALELSLLDAGRMAFAHSIRLAVQEGAPAGQSLQADISRALIAMSQAHAGAQVSKVFVVPGVQVPAEIQDVLDRRFPGAVQRLDPRDLVQSTSLNTEEKTLALKAGPAIGLLLSAAKPTVPVIDFINPRRRVEPPDTRKAKMRAIGGGAALLGLLGMWMNMNAVSDREAQLAAIQSETAGVVDVVNKGKATRDAAQLLRRWKESDPEPLAVLEKLESQLPPTSDVLLTDVYIKPGKPASGAAAPTIDASLKAVVWARTDEAITALENRLANGGYNLIAPMLPETNRLDPDYPRVSTLTLDQLIPPPAPPAKPKPPAN